MPNVHRLVERARAGIKAPAEALAWAVGADAAALWLHRRRTLVLAYHNIVPDGELPCGDRSLHLPQAIFAAQLDALMETHEVIPLQALNDTPSGLRPRVILTFDDAYLGAATVGIAELEKRGLPATVFVAPGLLGTATWWDRLADPASGAVPPAARETALGAHAGRADSVTNALRPGAMRLPSWACVANEQEVLAAAARPNITIGAHGWGHANLTALDPDALGDELRRPLAWLRAAGPAATNWLAYPYGLTSRVVAQAAATAGYAGAFRSGGGWLAAGERWRGTLHDLPRVNIPAGISPAGFRRRTAGLS